MSDSLATLISRLRCLLNDSASLAWSDSELSECLRQSLGDINQAAGQPWALSGLDGCAETDLPAGLTSLLVRGAAAYALLMLAGSRADLFSFQPGICQAYATASATFLKQFHCGLVFLAQVRVSDLQTSSDAPFPSATDELPGGWRLDGDLGQL